MPHLISLVQQDENAGGDSGARGHPQPSSSAGGGSIAEDLLPVSNCRTISGAFRVISFAVIPWHFAVIFFTCLGTVVPDTSGSFLTSFGRHTQNGKSISDEYWNADGNNTIWMCLKISKKRI